MFNEELGVVMQISNNLLNEIQEKYSSIGIESKTIATINNTYEVNIFAGKNLIYMII